MRTVFMCIMVAAFTMSALAARLPEERKPELPRSRPPDKLIYHLDLMEAELDVRFAMTVLQGLVNRTRPSLYISQDPGWHGSSCHKFWMEDLTRRGYEFQEISVEQALSRYGEYVNGAVLYESNLVSDPQSLHKLNALTLYCAIHNALPVTAELNERFRLPLVLDTRGKLLDPLECYKWAYNHLWPKANKTVLAHTCPTHMVLRDYLVQHKIMPIWISRGSSPAADSAAQRFIREAAPNAAVMGCWGGYGEQPPGRYSEQDLQRMASLYGKFVIVTDGCHNLSVVSGLDYKRHIQPKRAMPVLDRSKVYVVFHITDGDNLQWLQQEFLSSKWWNDPSRGKVPISWSLNPVAADLIPNFVEYVQSTASELDEFVCSTAGLGLVTPSLYGAETKFDCDKLYSAYLRATNEAMKRVGETCIHLGDTSGVPWTRNDFDRCAREMPQVKLILGDYGRGFTVFSDNSAYTLDRGVVVMRALSGVGAATDDDDRARQIAEGVKKYLSSARPAFVHSCLVNWHVNPTSILKAVQLLGDEFVPVLPSEAAKLFRQAQRSEAGGKDPN